MKPDLLRVVESAHDLGGQDRHWLQGVTDAVGPFLDDGYGAYGTFVDASRPARLRSRVVVRWRGHDAGAHAIFLVNNRESNSAATGERAARAFRPTQSIATASETLGAETFRAVVGDTVQVFPGCQDSAAVLALSPRGVGCLVTAPLSRTHRYPRSAKQLWARLVAHVVAMQRLRCSLEAAAVRRRDEGEAVLSPSGRVEHAEGPAQAVSARELLRAAAVESERARGRLRREDPATAVEMWRALVAGRWSIVDRFDRDGKRYLVAHQNEPDAIGPRTLTDRERQVVAFVAMGHSNKLVAYELGLSESAVGAYLCGARRKLGIRSRLDLVRLLHGMRG